MNNKQKCFVTAIASATICGAVLNNFFYNWSGAKTGDVLVMAMFVGLEVGLVAGLLVKR